MRTVLVLACVCWGCGGGGAVTVTIDFLAPGVDVRLFEGELIEVRFRVDSSRFAQVTILAVSRDPAFAPDVVIAANRRFTGGVQSVTWDTTGVASETYTIVAETRGVSIAQATGRIDIRPRPEVFRLVDIEPAEGAADVSRTEPIRFSFNYAVLPESLNQMTIDISYQGTFRVRPIGTLSVESGEVLFDPTADPDGVPNPDGLPANTVITVTVPLFDQGFPATDVARSIAGDPVDSAVTSNTIQFTTGD